MKTAEMLAFKEVEEFRAVAQLRENHCDKGAIDFPDPANGGTRASGLPGEV